MKQKLPPQYDVRPFAYDKRALNCDKIPLAELAAVHGTPLYVYSETQILERLELFEEAFRSVPHTICFAVKANSSLAILRSLAAHGAGFDIVSAVNLRGWARLRLRLWGRRCLRGWASSFMRLTLRCERASCCSMWNRRRNSICLRRVRSLSRWLRRFRCG